jgi:type II secretory pathway component PulF
VTLTHRLRFYQQLAVLARAGVPLRKSLERFKDRISGREIAVLSKKLEVGATIGEAFTAARFSPFECHLVTAGERSARLEDVYQHLAEFWSRQHEMIGALTGQLYYPFVVLNLSVVVGSLLELASASWPVVIIHMITSLAWVYGGIFILYMLLRVTWESEIAQGFWLSVPIIGRTLSTAYAYRWITALKLEYSAGIPMPDAVADAWRASGYVGRDALAREGEDALRAGGELSVLVQKWKRLPRDWVDFIETGEISGALETAFNNLEAEAARAWKVAQQRMTEWVPKILYFFILLIVAAQIVFSVKDYWDKNINGPINAALQQLP